MSAPLLQVNDLKKHFPVRGGLFSKSKWVYAVDGVSFEVVRGETLSLVTLENAVLVARYGGEEFALLLPGLDLPRITSLAEEARRSIEDLFITHAEAPCGYVTISIGVESIVPRPDQTAADLVEAADRALYAAKRCGRNTSAICQRSGK